MTYIQTKECARLLELAELILKDKHTAADWEEYCYLRSKATLIRAICEHALTC